VVTGRFNEKTQRPYTAGGHPIHAEGETLYAFALGGRRAGS